ncbi:MAG: hypothetical protein U0793_11635 [Gemmataceae bacterium]
MAFGTFKTLEEVVRSYQVHVVEQEFVRPAARAVDDRFRERLKFIRANAPVSASEEAICEFLIAPILQEAWLPFSDSLMLWSHVAFHGDESLTGFPDYFFARRSPLGPVREQPYVLFVEAKRDDFDAGWGQCLAAMIAAQRLNDRASRLIHAGVSNGRIWYFGKLDGSTLTQDPRAFTVDDLDVLFGALNYLLQQARSQALAPAA